MTFRGIVKNGVVLLNGDARLPDGTLVDIAPRARTSDRTNGHAKKHAIEKSVPKTPKRSPKPLHGFGPWKDRPDFDGLSSAQIATLLGMSAWTFMQRMKMSKRQRIAAALAACGSWKGRREWKGRSSADIAAMIRRRAARRAPHG